MQNSFHLQMLEFYNYLYHQKERPYGEGHKKSLETLIGNKSAELMKSVITEEGLTSILSFKNDVKVDRKKAINRIKEHTGIDFHIANQ